MRIKQAILEQINDSNIVKAKLIELNDVHPLTVQRWISNNDEKLTTAANMKVICDVMGFVSDEILEDEKAVA